MEGNDLTPVNGGKARNRTLSNNQAKPGTHADGRPAQIGTVYSSGLGEFKASKTEEYIRLSGYTHSQFQGMFKKVRNRISTRWNIWRPDQDVLMVAGLYLQEHTKRTFHSEELFKWGGWASYRRPKQTRYLERLADNGYLIRVKYKRGRANAMDKGYGFALSEKGMDLLLDIDRECEIVEAWHKDKNMRRLSECVLYLDRLDELVSHFQEALLTEEQKEKIRHLTVV